MIKDQGSQSQLLLGTMPSESNQSTENLITINISPNPAKENQNSIIKKALGQQDVKNIQDSSKLRSEKYKSIIDGNTSAQEQKYQQNKDANPNLQHKTQDQGSHSDYFDQKLSQYLLDSNKETENLLNNKQNQRQSVIDEKKLVLEDTQRKNQDTNAQNHPNQQSIKKDDNQENMASNQQEDKINKQLKDNQNNNNQIKNDQNRGNINQQEEGQPQQAQLPQYNSLIPDNNQSNKSNPAQNQSIKQAVNTFVQPPKQEPLSYSIPEIELVIVFQREYKNERIIYLQIKSFQGLEKYEFYLTYSDLKFSKVYPPILSGEIDKNTIAQIHSMIYYSVQMPQIITQNIFLKIIQIGHDNQRRIFQQCELSFFNPRNLYLRCNANINYEAYKPIYDQSRAAFMIFKLGFTDYLSFLKNQQLNEQQLSLSVLKDLHKLALDLLSFLKFWLMASMNLSFKNSVTDQQVQEYFDQLSFFMKQYWNQQNENEDTANAIKYRKHYVNETKCMIEELNRWYDLTNKTSKFIEIARMANLFGFEISPGHIDNFLISVSSEQQALQKFFQDAQSKDQVCVQDSLVIQILQIKSQQIRELTKFQNFLQENKAIVQSLICKQQQQQPTKITSLQKWIIDIAKPLLVQSPIIKTLRFFEFIKIDFKIIFSDLQSCIEQTFQQFNFDNFREEEDENVILDFLKQQRKNLLLILSEILLNKILPLQLIKRTKFTNQLVNLCSNLLEFKEMPWFIDILYKTCSKQASVQEKQRNELDEISVSLMLSVIFQGWCLNFRDSDHNQPAELLQRLLNKIYLLLNEEFLKQHYSMLQEILKQEKRQANNQKTKDFIEQVIAQVDKQFINKVISKANDPEKYLNLIQIMTNENQTLIKGYSKNSIALALFEQANTIKPFSEDTLFSSEFYPSIVERLRYDGLFQQSSLFMRCKAFAMTYKNQTQITWKKYHNWTSSKKLYQQFLSCFDVSITLTLEQEKKLSEVSSRMQNIKKFIELVSGRFSVPSKLRAFHSVSDQEYNNKTIKEILSNNDLGELNEFQDIIEISSYLWQSSLFTKFSRLFSQEDNLKQVCHNITRNIIPRLFYMYQYLLQLTSSNSSEEIKIQSYPNKFKFDLEEILASCPALKGNYLFYLENGLTSIPTGRVEEEIESLFGIFQTLMGLSKEYKLKVYPLVILQETSVSMRNFINLISFIEEQSRKTSLVFPENLQQFLNEISQQKNITIQNVEHNHYISKHQEISQEFQEFIDFSKVEEKEYHNKIKVFEFIHRIISVDQIVQKYSIETIKEIRLSDQEDVGSAASELLKIIQDLKKNKDKLNFKTILEAYAFCKKYLAELQARPYIIEKINYVSQFTHKLTENLEEFLQNKQQNSQMIMNSFLENGSIEIFYSFKSNEPSYSIQFLVTLKNEPNKILDMNEIYQMQSRLQLFAKGKTINNEQHISDIFIDKKNKFEQFITFAEQIQLVLCELQEIGYLEDQIIKVVVAVEDNGKAIAKMGDLKTDLNNKAQEWKQLLIQEKMNNPVLHLIPNRLLRSLASYFVLKYNKLHDDLDDQIVQFKNEKKVIEQIVQDKNEKKVIKSLDIKYQQYQTCEETHINNCFFFLKLMNIDSDNLQLNDNNADQLTSFSYDSETSERAGAIIGVLQDQFQKQKLIIPIDLSGISETLKIRKVAVSNTEGCLKFLLRFPGISQFQILFCDEETSIQDIETFISRVRFFQLQNHSKDSDKYFLVNFHLLKHFSQQYIFKVATELSSQQTKSPNSLFVIYQVKLKSQKSCLEDKQKQEIWDDFLRIVSDETQYEDTVEVSKQNVFLFHSKKAGEGKSFQINKLMDNNGFRLPLHSFKDKSHLMKSVLKIQDPGKDMKRLSLHLEICFDQNEEIDILLYQIIMLNSIFYNFKHIFVFPKNCIFYIEKANYFDIPYATFLQFINSTPELKLSNNKRIECSLDNLEFNDYIESQDQVVLRYLNGLQFSEDYFYLADFTDPFQPLDVIEKQAAIEILTDIFIKHNLNEITYTHVKLFFQQFYIQIRQFETIESFSSMKVQEIEQQAIQMKMQADSSLFQKFRNIVIEIIMEQSLNNTFLVEEEIVNKDKSKEIFEKKLFMAKQVNSLKRLRQKHIENSENSQQQHLKGCFKACFLKCFNSKQYKQIVNEEMKQLGLIEQDYQKSIKVNEDIWKVDRQNIQLVLSEQENRIYQKNKMKKYENLMKDILFFKRNTWTAAIQNKEKQKENLNSFFDFLSIYSSLYLHSESIVIPSLNENNQELLAHTLINITCDNPGTLIDLGTMKKRDQLDTDILKQFILTPDNTFKMIQIAYRIMANLPIIIMGETGIGKTQSIKILAQLMDYGFEVIEVDPGILVESIISGIESIERKAQKNSQKIIIFFDEFNTTQAVNGILKEIIIDRHLNGRKVDENILFVAACNPYEYRKYESDKTLTSGIQESDDHLNNNSKLVYHVEPMRESYAFYIVNYESLGQQEENIYILNMINLFSKRPGMEIQKKEISKLQRLLMQSQLFIRNEQTDRSVSLRDVSRFLNLLEFFKIKYFSCQKYSSEEINHRSIVLSSYMIYQLRLLNQKKRQFYQEFFQYLWYEDEKETKDNVNSLIKSKDSFSVIVKEELEWLMKQCSISSKYIAKNQALMENTFCILICILNKIPLIITGEPGTSKTLSFSIALGALKDGSSSSSSLFKDFSIVKEFYYQGNMQTTSRHISEVFEQALIYQNKISEHVQEVSNQPENGQQKMQKKRKAISVVFYDEIGQGEKSVHNPNKILHFLLENSKLAFVAISNSELDLAKMNRCMHLPRLRLSNSDLKEFAEKIAFEFKITKPSEIDILRNFANVYNTFRDKCNNNIHSTRDFYYTIKYTCFQISQKPQDEKGIIDILTRALFKNFDGSKANLQLISNTFKENFQLQHLPQPMKKELISETLNSINNGEFYHSRFLMIISKNPQYALNYIQNIFKEHQKQAEVFVGSDFKEDKNKDMSREISSINSLIEQKINIISVQQHYLYTIYYDFFTMNFIKVGDKNTFRISYKSYATRIDIPSEFIFTIIVTPEEYAQIDTALINRFEKYFIESSDVLNPEQQQVLDILYDKVQRIKSELKSSVFVLSSKSDLTSIILAFSSINQAMDEQQKQILCAQCLNELGNISTRQAIINQTSNMEFFSLYEEWLSRGYLDDLIEFTAYSLKNNKEVQQQEKHAQGFKAIVYTTSQLYENCAEKLLSSQGLISYVIDLKIKSSKIAFLDEMEIFFQSAKSNLLLVVADQNEESLQNICYVKSELDKFYNNYYNDNNNNNLNLNINQQKNINQLTKHIIFIIQINPQQNKGLSYGNNWKQVQIDNLLPYIYTLSTSYTEQAIHRIRSKLNFRYLSQHNLLTIIEDKDIFNYFTGLPGFAVSMMTSFSISSSNSQDHRQLEEQGLQKISNFSNQQPLKKTSELCRYLNQRIEYFQGLFSQGFENEQSGMLNFLYQQLIQKIHNNNNFQQDWSKNINSSLFWNSIKKDSSIIPLLNFEKIMMSHIKRMIAQELSQIVILMEQKGFLLSNQRTAPLKEQQDDVKYISDYFNQNIKYNNEGLNILSSLNFIPKSQNLICSKGLFKKIEDRRSDYDNDIQNFEFLVSREVSELFGFIQQQKNIKLYLEDILQIKAYSKNLKDTMKYLWKYFPSFQSIHVFLWKHEKMMIRLCDCLDIFLISAEEIAICIQSNWENASDYLNDFLLEFITIQILQDSSLPPQHQRATTNALLHCFVADNDTADILNYLLELKELLYSENISLYEEINRKLIPIKKNSVDAFFAPTEITFSKYHHERAIFSLNISYFLIHMKISFINRQIQHFFVEKFLHFCSLFLAQDYCDESVSINIKKGLCMIADKIIIEQTRFSNLGISITSLLNQSYEQQQQQSQQQDYIQTRMMHSYFQNNIYKMDSAFARYFINCFSVIFGDDLHRKNILKYANYESIVKELANVSSEIASFSLILKASILQASSQCFVDIINANISTGLFVSPIQNKSIQMMFQYLSSNIDLQNTSNNSVQIYLYQQALNRNPSLKQIIDKLSSNYENNYEYRFIYQLNSIKNLNQTLFLGNPFDKISCLDSMNKNYPMLKLLKDQQNLIQNLKYVYPIVQFSNSLRIHLNFKLTINEIKEKTIFQIKQEYPEINYLIDQTLSCSVEKILNNPNAQLLELTLEQFLFLNGQPNKSNIFAQIYEIVATQNKLLDIAKIKGQTKKLHEVSYSDLINVEYNNFLNDKDFYVFVNAQDSSQINFKRLQEYYLATFIQEKPRIDCSKFNINQFLQTRSNLGTANFIYDNLLIKQEPLSKLQSEEFLKLLRNPTLLIDLRDSLLKLLKLIRAQFLEDTNQEKIFISFALETHKITEQEDYEVQNAIEQYQLRHVCSIIEIIEIQLMDFLVSLSRPIDTKDSNINLDEIQKLLQSVLLSQQDLIEFVGRFIIRVEASFADQSQMTNIFQIGFELTQEKLFSTDKIQQFEKIKQSLMKIDVTVSTVHAFYKQLKAEIHKYDGQRKDELQAEYQQREQNKLMGNINIINLPNGNVEGQMQSHNAYQIINKEDLSSMDSSISMC